MFTFDLTIMIFLFVFSTVLVLIAYLYRSQFPPSAMLFFIGILWMVLFLNTSEVSIGSYIEQTDTTYNNVTDTITEINTVADNKITMYDAVTGEPTMVMFAFISMSLIWVIAGALIEREGIMQFVSTR